MFELDGKKYKVAIIHDWFCNMGGAENLVELFMDIFPEAPIYTSCYLNKSLTEKLKTADIRTSFLQEKLNQKKDNHQKLLPLMPTAFESFDLNEYDIVFSSSTCCSKGIIKRPDTLHICYCGTPMRYAWEFMYEYTKKMGKTKKMLVGLMMNYMKLWDFSSSNRVDYFIANSENVSKRIKNCYGRESKVIWPAVDIEYFSKDLDNVITEDFYLCVSRLVPYKRIDLAVEACNRLKKRLVIIGMGAEESRLKEIAGTTIEILGRQPREIIRDYYQRCKAFIFPGEEDFGITPVEAQACGKPVIAYARGGALETVIERKTGIFFNEQTVNSLVEAINRLESMNIKKEDCISNSVKFSNERFIKEIETFVSEKMRDHISQFGGCI